MFNPKTQISRAENIVLRIIHGSYFLINITDNYNGDQCSLLELNEMGNYVWNKIGDGCTVNALADQLFKEIVDDVSFQTVFDDICEFVQALLMQILDFATTKRTEWEENHKLYSVVFEITPRCNFNCVHCYLHDHHCSKELSFDEIIRILDILYQNEVLFLTLTGGDVFMRRDFVDIYTYAKKKGFIVELYTNAALLDERILSVLKKYPPLL